MQYNKDRYRSMSRLPPANCLCENFSENTLNYSTMKLKLG